MKAHPLKLTALGIFSFFFFLTAGSAHARVGLNQMIDSQPYFYVAGGFLDENQLVITARFTQNPDLAPDQDMKAEYQSNSLRDTLHQLLDDFSQSKRGRALQLSLKQEPETELNTAVLSRFEEITKKNQALFIIIKDSKQSIRIKFLIGLSDLLCIGESSGATLEDAMRSVIDQVRPRDER